MSSSAPRSLETIPRLIFFAGLDYLLLTPLVSSCLEPPTTTPSPKATDTVLPKSQDLQQFPDVAVLLRGLTVLYPSRPLRSRK